MTDEIANPAIPSGKKAWEQQAEEPGEAYVRFLIYRNLGPSRTLNAAYALASKKVSKGAKRRRSPISPKRAPGQWERNSAAYHWHERAIAWDIEMLSTHGIQTVTRFLEALDVISQKALLKLKENKTKPRSWQDVLAVITLLGTFIPAETVAQIQSFAVFKPGVNQIDEPLALERKP